MTTDADTATRFGRLSATPGDALDVVETEMAVLARALEGLHRRSEIYRELDRASYLIARTLETTGPVSINGADPDDGRVSLISLSQTGHRRMRAVRLARRERIARLLHDWTDDDRRDLGRLLARFNDELSRDIANDNPRA
jgi:hypothetical protein